MANNRFLASDISIESQWRAIVLFGKNSATYKFAFAKSLLQLAEQGKTIIRLEDLAQPFSSHIVEHLRQNEKQGSSSSSTFLKGCQDYIDGKISDSDLHKLTVQYGFVNVVDAFHIENRDNVPNLFYQKNYTGSRKELHITDNLLKLKELTQFKNFGMETEARWRLVETAWNLRLNPSMLHVQYDEANEALFIKNDIMRRINITSAKDALNGYQKGKCFYTKREISIQRGSPNICAVDHFFPHLNKQAHLPANVNGVWNLVLAHSVVNGSGDKGAKVPCVEYVERLYDRNEYYIESKHPLAETIINQTGATQESRRAFLQRQYDIARSHCIHIWKAKED